MTTKEIAHYLHEKNFTEGTDAFNDAMTDKLDILFSHHRYGEDGWWEDHDEADEWARGESEVRYRYNAIREKKR